MVQHFHLVVAWRHWPSFSRHTYHQSAISTPYFSRGSPFSRCQFVVYYCSVSIGPTSALPRSASSPCSPSNPLPSPPAPCLPVAEPSPAWLPACRRAHVCLINPLVAQPSPAWLPACRRGLVCLIAYMPERTLACLTIACLALACHLPLPQ